MPYLRGIRRRRSAAAARRKKVNTNLVTDKNVKTSNEGLEKPLDARQTVANTFSVVRVHGGTVVQMSAYPSSVVNLDDPGNIPSTSAYSVSNSGEYSNPIIVEPPSSISVNSLVSGSLVQEQLKQSSQVETALFSNVTATSTRFENDCIKSKEVACSHNSMNQVVNETKEQLSMTGYPVNDNSMMDKYESEVATIDSSSVSNGSTTSACSSAMNDVIMSERVTSSRSSLNQITNETEQLSTVSHSVSESFVQDQCEPQVVIDSSNLSDGLTTSACCSTMIDTNSMPEEPTLSNTDVKPSCSFDKANSAVSGEIIINKNNDHVKDLQQTESPGTNKCETQESKRREENTEERDEECSVCLQTLVHPAKLPCSHVFCFLCLKGLARSHQTCPLCRAFIPYHFTNNPQLVPSSESNPVETGQEEYCWFYQGRNGGWWQFEKRMSDEIESHRSLDSAAHFEMMICGSLYVIDTVSCIQYPRNCPTRVRRLLRDLPSRVNKKGVAGIHENRR